MKIKAIDDCPYYLLTRAGLAITSELKKGFAEAGIDRLRPAYLGALMALWEEDGLKVIDLGRRAGLEPSTMTGLLDRMERDGLVSREDDPADRRAHIIRLTEAGAALRVPAEKTVGAILDNVFAEIPPKNIDELKSTLRLVLAGMREGG